MYPLASVTQIEGETRMGFWENEDRGGLEEEFQRLGSNESLIEIVRVIRSNNGVMRVASAAMGKEEGCTAIS